MPEPDIATNRLVGHANLVDLKRRIRRRGAFERFRWILLSYFTSPMFLVIAGFGTLLIAVGLILPAHYFQYRLKHNYPHAPVPRLLLNSQEMLDEVRRLGQQHEVDGIDLPALWWDGEIKKRKLFPLAQKTSEISEPPESFFEVVNEFPNLRWVKYGLVHGSNGLAQVAKLTELEDLTLESGGTIDLSLLRPLQNLRRIVFRTKTAPANIAALAELPKLETLAFESRLWVGDAVLGELARLSQLKLLILSLHQGSADQVSLTRAGFESLAHGKSLKTLYVGGSSPEDRRQLFAMARNVLPNMKILHAVFVQRDPSLILYLTPPILFLAIGIGIPLCSHFRNPLKRLVPGYAISHGIIGVGLASAVVVVSGVQLVIGGAKVLPAVIVPACLVTAGIAYTESLLLAAMVGLQRKTLWLVVPHLAVMFIVGFVVTAWLPDQILQGEAPGILAILAAVTITECGFAAWALSRMVDWSSASCIPERPADWKWESSENLQPGPKFWASVGRTELRLDALLPATAEWNWLSRIQRWRLGNPPLPLLGSSTQLIALITEVALIAFLGAHFIPFAMCLRFIPLCICCWFWGVTCEVSARWRMRMLILSLELTRPYSRRRLQSELIAGMVMDLAPLCVLFAAMLACVLNLDATLRIDWARVPGDFVLWLLVGFITQIESTAVQIVIDRLWLASTALFLSAAVNVAVVYALLLRIPDFELLTVTSAMVESQLWAPALIAVIVSAVMARHFFQMEIGRRV